MKFATSVWWMSKESERWKSLQDEEVMGHGHLRRVASKLSTGNPIKIEISLMVMDARPKWKRNEFKPLDQNFRPILIKSKSRVTLTMVSLMNWAIPNNSKCP